jgi:hypothetical protein
LARKEFKATYLGAINIYKHKHQQIDTYTENVGPGVETMSSSRYYIRRAAVIAAVVAPAIAVSVFFYTFKDNGKKPSLAQKARIENAVKAQQARRAFDMAKDSVEKIREIERQREDFARACPKQIKSLYKSIGDLGGLTLEAFAAGYGAYKKAADEGRIRRGRFILVDYTQESDRNRFYIFDFSKKKLIGAIKVSHGIGNGYSDKADSVSNVPQSYATPAGLMRIRGVGMGKLEGWTLDGLEPQNSNTLTRAIIIHEWKTPNRISGCTSPTTSGCLGLNGGDAREIGLPLDRESTEKSAAAWQGTGVYVYF